MGADGREGLGNCEPSPRALDATHGAAHTLATFENARPARFLKQVVTMLLAITPGSFAARELDLAAFAQDPDWVGLPPNYQIYLSLYAGPFARFNGGTGRMR